MGDCPSIGRTKCLAPFVGNQFDRHTPKPNNEPVNPIAQKGLGLRLRPHSTNRCLLQSLLFKLLVLASQLRHLGLPSTVSLLCLDMHLDMCFGHVFRNVFRHVFRHACADVSLLSAFCSCRLRSSFSLTCSGLL